MGVQQGIYTFTKNASAKFKAIFQLHRPSKKNEEPKKTKQKPGSQETLLDCATEAVAMADTLIQRELHESDKQPVIEKPIVIDTGCVVFLNGMEMVKARQALQAAVDTSANASIVKLLSDEFKVRHVEEFGTKSYPTADAELVKQAKLLITAATKKDDV